jgi:hypothetical protein
VVEAVAVGIAVSGAKLADWMGDKRANLELATEWMTPGVMIEGE